MADRFLVILIILVGFATVSALSYSFFSTQNQQFIKNAIDKQTDDIKQLQHGQENAAEQRTDFYKSILGNITHALGTRQAEHAKILNLLNSSLDNDTD